MYLFKVTPTNGPYKAPCLYIEADKEQRAIELAKETASKASKAIGANLTGLYIIFSKEYDRANVLEGQTDPGYTKQFDMPKALAEATYKNLIEK